VIEVILLIRQIRSLGSFSKVYGEHAPHLFDYKRLVLFLKALWTRTGVGKPKVTFMAPTFFIGGSNYSSTPQGGYNKIKDVTVSLIMLLTFGGLFSSDNKPLSSLKNDGLKNRDINNLKRRILLYSAPKVFTS
jgi:hypothetical protein